MCIRTRFIIYVCAIILALGGHASGQLRNNATQTPTELSDREKDGLVGPVRRVTVESSKIIFKNGSATEAPRVVREVTTYDPRGKKLDAVAYPIDGDTLPGREQYKYDDRGNIVEMQLRSQDGRLLSKEIYKYQLDEVGNWKKMTTSLAVFQDGKVSDEPVEVTYRTITYFYSQDIAKLVAAVPAKGSGTNPVHANEVGNLKPTGRLKTGTPAIEPPAPSRNETRFTNTAGTNNVSPQADSARSGDAKPSLMSAEAVPVSQNISSTNLTLRPEVQRPDVSSSVPTDKVSSEEKTKISNERALNPSGNNSVPATTPAGNSSVSVASEATSLYQLGLSYLETGKPAEAIQPLKQVVHKDPENALGYLKLGLAYSALHQYTEAIAVFKIAIQIRRDLIDAEAYYQLGQAYANTGKNSDAVAALKQALYITRADGISPEGQKARTAPSLEQLHYSLGLVYHRLTRYRDAVKELQKVIEINPKIAAAHYGLALCYIALGDRKSAEKQQKVLATLDPDLAQKVADVLSTNRIMPPGVTEGMLGPKRMN
ncbi:MAG TPA: tetratricopeptide repeat protein [Pyrinomonadaceae bacterium]|nr:tetratricopeptide repeat protein [Pyrinomonadaceae bacterium]